MLKIDQNAIVAISIICLTFLAALLILKSAGALHC